MPACGIHTANGSNRLTRAGTEALDLRLLLNLSKRHVDGLKQIAEQQNRPVGYIIRAAIEAMITANQTEQDSK